jgi:hypothetical protein
VKSCQVGDNRRVSSEEDPTTRELRLKQEQREREEREAAEHGFTDEDTGTHDARAAKAAYLRKKLEERAEAERKARGD